VNHVSWYSGSSSRRRETYMAHSLGAKRLTPASTAASIKSLPTVFSGSLFTTMKLRTASTPLKYSTSSALSSKEARAHVTPCC
jgi:hypothetical protein